MLVLKKIVLQMTRKRRLRIDIFKADIENYGLGLFEDFNFIYVLN